MFCPDCKAEYRPGFTRCSDCDAALVERLEETEIHTNKPEPSGAAELLWTGTDTQTRDEIIDALETAKISYHTRTDKVGSLPGWSRQVYAIFTHARDHRAANAALEEADRRQKKRTTGPANLIHSRRRRRRLRTTTNCPTSRPITFPRISIRTRRPSKSGPARTPRPEKIWSPASATSASAPQSAIPQASCEFA